MARSDSIWEVLRQASETLPEPFSAHALITWVSKRRPDVAEASIRTHLNYALVESRRTGPWSSRTPFLTRVDRGLYRRYRGPSAPQEATPTFAPEMPVPTPTARAPSDGRVILVGCSRTKGPNAAPAMELFEGPLFRRARDHAVRTGAPWFVLSAKFGLLDPGEPIAPYDVYLRDQPDSYRDMWGRWVVEQLAARLPLTGTTVEVHASDAYCGPLRAPLRAAGAVISEPLAGLRQGEQLAWAGYRAEAPDVETAVDVEVLLDPARAVSPAALLERGPEGLDVPGLYTWWIDEAGAADVSRGMGYPVAPGLLYAGKAGGHRREAAPSSATLWGRIAGNHPRGNARSSTFRKSLAAVLGAAGVAHSEDELTAWMHAHLRVHPLPVPSADVARLEDDLVARARPPLNLAGLPKDDARSALSPAARAPRRQPPAGRVAAHRAAVAGSP